MEVLPPIPKVRIDIVFDDKKVCEKFEKYFKEKKEVRKTEINTMAPNRFRLTVTLEKPFAEAKVIPALTKLMNHPSFVVFAITDLQKTMATA